MKLIVRRAETPDQLSSRHFSVDITGTTVLRMEKGVSYFSFSPSVFSLSLTL